MYDGGWRKSRKYGKGVYIYADGHRCATFWSCQYNDSISVHYHSFILI
jgi:hypothetical protein